MGLILKNNATGIDRSVDLLQNYLWENISWNKDPLTTDSYQSYHRAYKNESNNGLKFEVFTQNNDYKEVLHDDRYLASSFFITSDEVNINNTGKETTNISVIFQVNLKRLYPSVLHRADEECHREVMNILKNNPFNYELVRLTKGIRNVYSEIGYGEKEFEDMNPFHVFRIDFENVTICC